MKTLLFSVLFCLNVFGAQSPQFLLDSISQHAIRIGNGENKDVYVFVDPMCRHSRNYLNRITLNPDLQSQNSYYIFLYGLEKFESQELIGYIYQSKNKKALMEDVMVLEKEMDLDEFEVSPETLQVINDIEKVGELLKIQRRPFIVKP